MPYPVHVTRPSGRREGSAAHLLLARATDTADLVLALNFVFAAIYLASALLTYSALRLPSKSI